MYNQRQRRGSAAWEKHRQAITQLYQVDGNSLEHVRTIMEQRYGFKPSASMYKKQLARWGVSKYIKQYESAYALQQINARRAQGKLTRILIRDQEFTEDQLQKSCNRRARLRLLDDSLDTPDGVRVLTPISHPSMTPQSSSIRQQTIDAEEQESRQVSSESPLLVVRSRSSPSRHDQGMHHPSRSILIDPNMSYRREMLSALYPDDETEIGRDDHLTCLDPIQEALTCLHMCLSDTSHVPRAKVNFSSLDLASPLQQAFHLYDLNSQAFWLELNDILERNFVMMQACKIITVCHLLEFFDEFHIKKPRQELFDTFFQCIYEQSRQYYGPNHLFTTLVSRITRNGQSELVTQALLELGKALGTVPLALCEYKLRALGRYVRRSTNPAAWQTVIEEIELHRQYAEQSVTCCEEYYSALYQLQSKLRDFERASRILSQWESTLRRLFHGQLPIKHQIKLINYRIQCLTGQGDGHQLECEALTSLAVILGQPVSNTGHPFVVEPVRHLPLAGCGDDRPPPTLEQQTFTALQPT